MNTSSFLTMMVSLMIMFVCLAFVCTAQCDRIDSLKTLLGDRTGKDRVDVFFELARAHAESNHQKCFLYASEANRLAYMLGDSFRIVQTTRGKAQAYRRLGELDSALTLLEKILPVARQNKYFAEVKTILNALGLAYFFKARYDEALRCFFESLELTELSGDRNGLGVVLNNIGLVYQDLGDFDTALRYYYKTLNLAEKENQEIIAGSLLNIGICHAHSENHQEAIQYLNKAMSICGNACPEWAEILFYQTTGIINLRQKKLEQAEKDFLKSYGASGTPSYHRHHLNNLVGLIEVYLLLNKRNMAEKYVKEAEMISQAGSSYNYEMSQIYSQLIRSYEESSNYRKLSYYQAKYISVKDSIFNKQHTKNLMKIEAEHVEKEKNIKIESQNRILTLNNRVIQQQEELNIIISIVALLLIILTALLVRSNQHKRQINRQLDNKVLERTKELLLNQTNLQRTCEERDALSEKVVADVNSCLATIKGLCLLGIKDINYADYYLRKVQTTTEKVSESVTKLYKKNHISFQAYLKENTVTSRAE